MALIGTIPRRCVNLPPRALTTLLKTVLNKQVQEGPQLKAFHETFSQWLGAPHVFGTATGRSAFQLALEALDLPKGSEIIFPSLTFPVMPMVAKLYGYEPVFCDVDPETFNSGPEHVAAKITDKTSAVLATHLFGQPCLIEEIAALTKKQNLCLMEDCAHACGVRINGKQVGTFGQIGIFSFAEGKNMPCFGGGAIATADESIAQRAQAILDNSRFLPTDEIRKKAVDIWIKWLVTRPQVFGLSAYIALRLKLMLGKPLMDSVIREELVDKFANSNPQINKLANLQAALGLSQLKHIDAFNEGARRNAEILTASMGEVPGVKPPKTSDRLSGNHIYVYYPLTVAPDKRDDLRHYLLRHGIDSKISDMADCRLLRQFQSPQNTITGKSGPNETSILEICVYPVIPEREMKRLGRLIRTWAGLAPLSE